VIVSGTSIEGRIRRVVGALCLALATGAPTPSGAQVPPNPADTLRAALDRSRALEDSAALAEAENAYGLLHWNQARYDSAVAHLQEARSIWTALNDSVGLGRVNNNLGAAHYQWGNLEPALESFLRALSVRRALGDDRGVSLVLSNMGLTFRDWGLFERAREAMQEAVATGDQAGDPFVRGYARNNLGLVLLAMGDLAGARAAFQESLVIYETPDPRITPAQARSGWGLNTHGLARVHLAEGDARRTVTILEELFGGSPEDARTGRQAQALVDLGLAYQATGATDRAVRILELALELSREAGQRTLTLDALDGLSRVHQVRGEPVAALAYLRRHESLRDSLVTQSGALQIAALEQRAEAERQADHIGRCRVPAGEARMKAKVALQPRHAVRHSDHEQTEDNYDRAADDVGFVAVLQQQLAKQSGARTKCNEHRAEAEHEQSAQYGRTDSAAVIGARAHGVRRLAGDVRDVRRD